MNYSLDQKQKLVINNCKELEVNQITKIISLNESEYLIESSLGKILIKGLNLELITLNLDEGKLKLQGTIYLVEYLDINKKDAKADKEKPESFLKKVFR